MRPDNGPLRSSKKDTGLLLGFSCELTRYMATPLSKKGNKREENS